MFTRGALFPAVALLLVPASGMAQGGGDQATGATDEATFYGHVFGHTITLEANDLQGSATGVCKASFTLERGKSSELVPGTSQQGVCGLQSASDAFVDEVAQGASKEGGS